MDRNISEDSYEPEVTEAQPKESYEEEQAPKSYGRGEVERASWMGDEAGEEIEDGQLALDVYQDNDYVVIKSIIGGIRPEDLDLTVTADMVTIKGTRRNYEEVDEDNYYYKECFWGSFSRSVILPCDIKTDQVEALMKNGVLTIRLPKVEKNCATKISVQGE